MDYDISKNVLENIIRDASYQIHKLEQLSCKEYPQPETSFIIKLVQEILQGVIMESSKIHSGFDEQETQLIQV